MAITLSIGWVCRTRLRLAAKPGQRACLISATDPIAVRR